VKGQSKDPDTLNPTDTLNPSLPKT
jgi:hypothetical protein